MLASNNNTNLYRPDMWKVILHHCSMERNDAKRMSDIVRPGPPELLDRFASSSLLPLSLQRSQVQSPSVPPSWLRTCPAHVAALCPSTGFKYLQIIAVRFQDQKIQEYTIIIQWQFYSSTWKSQIALLQFQPFCKSSWEFTASLLLTATVVSVVLFCEGTGFISSKQWEFQGVFQEAALDHVEHKVLWLLQFFQVLLDLIRFIVYSTRNPGVTIKLCLVELAYTSIPHCLQYQELLHTITHSQPPLQVHKYEAQPRGVWCFDMTCLDYIHIIYI